MIIVRLTVTALICATLCAGRALAQLSPSTRPATTASSEIDELIAQLTSPSETTRQLAKEKLLKLGEPARQALEAHVRARATAESTLKELDANRIAAPTLVTLRMADVRPDAVLAEFVKQTGYEIQPQNDSFWQEANLPNVSIAVDQQPFWTAFKQFCADAGVVMYNSGGAERKILLMPANQYAKTSPFKCPSSARGAFLVLITNIQRTSSLNLADPQNIQRSMWMQMQVLAEPKVRIVRYAHSADLSEAVDEKGDSLLVAGGDRLSGRSYISGRSLEDGLTMPASRGLIMNVAVPLQYPANAGQKIARLRGQLRVVAQVRSDQVEIPDVLSAKDVSKTLDGHRIVLKEVKKTGDRQYQASVVFYRDGMAQKKFGEMCNNPTVRLLDSEGREFMSSGRSNGDSTTEQAEMKLGFSQRNPPALGMGVAWGGGPAALAGGEPAKLVWEIVANTQDILVPFEFTDLPLP